jgi:hypothetical protein
MKTSNMDYEKKYKEALEKIRSLHRDYNQISTLINVKEELEKIFPELAESENERIRKEIISAVNIYCSEYSRGTKVREEMLAWLEKQGDQKPSISDEALREGISKFGITQYQIDFWLKKYINVAQKPTDKVEPKFKHGDRVRNKKSGLEQTLGSCIEDVYEGAFPFRIKEQDDWELVD